MAEDLERLRDIINQHLLRADFESAGIVIAKAVPVLLQFSVDEWVDDVEDIAPERPSKVDDRSDIAKADHSSAPVEASNDDSESGDNESSSSSSTGGDSSDEDDDGDDGSDITPINSYRYRSMIHIPHNPRLEHLCNWLYDTVVHPDSNEEPEEQACQKLPAAILAAWRRLQFQQQSQQPPLTQPPPSQQDPSESQSAPSDPAPQAPNSAAPCTSDPTSPPAPLPPVVPPTEALHLQHSAFSAPFCTWRPVAPDALPALHDVLVGVLRVCWERHDEREPPRNIIWGAQSHSRRDDPMTAYLYVEYLRLLLAAIVRSRAEPLWVWHELQEVIEEYPHWRRHPHEVAVLARMMVEHGCGWRLLNSVLDHIGKAPLLMYATWAALWDGLRRAEARACARLASQYGMAADGVWVHVAELTLLQVKEHPRDTRLLNRAVAVLSRVLGLTPAPTQLAALLRAERDAPGSCEGVREVTSQLPLSDYAEE